MGLGCERREAGFRAGLLHLSVVLPSWAHIQHLPGEAEKPSERTQWLEGILQEKELGRRAGVGWELGERVKV